MLHRLFFLVGILFLWSAYKHQQLERLLTHSKTPKKEITNPTVEGLAHFQSLESENLEKIKALIEAGSIHTRNRFGSTPLLLAACQTGDPQIVQYLHSRGAKLQDRDSYGNTALMCAAEAGNVRLVQWLLERGARVNQKNRLGQTALFFAAKEGKYHTVRALLNKGAKAVMKDVLGRTPQHVAVKNRHVKVANLLRSKQGKGRTLRTVY